MLCCLVSLMAVVMEVVECYKDTEVHSAMGVSFRSEMSVAVYKTNSPAYLVIRTPNREGLFLKRAAWKKKRKKNQSHELENPIENAI